MLAHLPSHPHMSHTGGTWYTTYTAVPFYLTNYQRAFLLESLEYAIFDLTNKELVSITLNTTNMVGRIITGGCGQVWY